VKTDSEPSVLQCDLLLRQSRCTVVRVCSQYLVDSRGADSGEPGGNSCLVRELGAHVRRCLRVPDMNTSGRMSANRAGEPAALGKFLLKP